MSGLLGAWPPLPPGALFRRPRPLPFPLDDDGAVITSRARGGLFLGMKALGIDRGDAVLAPAYHHGSEIEAIRRTGAEVVFYGGTARLEPDADELESLIGPATRALHLTHFLGFPQDSPRWRRWCDERGLLLIEDAAQSWLAQSGGRPVGSHGDLAVFCLYKTIGVPDGAAAVCRESIAAEAPPAASGALPAVKRIVAWGAQRPRAARRLALRGVDAEQYDPVADFALGEPAQPPARATAHLLPRINLANVAQIRRSHYQRLLETLGDRVSQPFDTLPPGAVPWLFPLRTSDKAAMISRLRREGVSPVDFWSVPHPALDEARFPAIAGRRGATVGLPVHQELTDRDVKRIGELVLGSPP